jgi:AcrR family transcriptional regulator
MTEKINAKDKIMSKALELFSAKGYEGVSVNELTAAAGITKPTLYYYFGSKEGLFEAISQLHYANLNSIIEKNAIYNPNPNEYEKDILKTLSRVTKSYFSFAQSNEAFYMCILANLSMPRSSVVFKIVEKHHFTQFDIIENMFKNMAKIHGNLRGKAKMLTWSFIGMINSCISLHFSGFAVQKFDEKSVRELVRQFMHGIFA